MLRCSMDRYPRQFAKTLIEMEKELKTHEVTISELKMLERTVLRGGTVLPILLVL